MKEKIKIGYIGLGRRGTGVLKECLSKMPDVEIVALCDKYLPHLENAKKLLEEKNYPMPILTENADDVFANKDIDAIFIMTGWQEHTDLAIKSMRAGKYTAIEVGCAFDLDDCYRLINTYEETGVPLMMLENACYGRNELMALNIVKQGLFGDVVHCAGGYCHELPEVELFKDIDKEYKHYRLASYIHRNCDQYPTHDLGPISKLLNINRGNRMVKLSSFASKTGGLKESAKYLLGEDSPYAKIDYKQGDIITTVITCANGETIHLTLDTTLPRPYYSRNFTIRGTKGMYGEERRVVFFQGMAEPVENNEEEMQKKYDHPIHKENEKYVSQGDHNGLDWITCRAFIESVKNGTNTPIDAYDTVSWMAIAPLSEMSIAKGGMPMDIPDFTKGKWINREPSPYNKYSLNEVCIDESTTIYPEGYEV